MLLTALLLLLLGGAGGVVGVWYSFFNGEPPGAATIDTAASAVPSAGPVAPGSLDGTWTVDTSIGSFSDFSDSWAGFRVNEVLDNIGDATAIGRTPRRCTARSVFLVRRSARPRSL